VARTFQRNNLFHNLSVIENLRLALVVRFGQPLDFFRPAAGDAALQERARQLMRTVHLGDDGERIARSLSYGASLPRTLSILMIEHDMDVVFSVADRITVLYYGRILATGTPADIQANARVREVYLGMAH